MKRLFITAVMASHLFAFVDSDVHCCSQELMQESMNVVLKNPTKTTSFYNQNAHKLAWDEGDIRDFLKVANDPIKNYLFLDYHQDEILDLVESLDSYDDFEKRKIRAQIELLATDGFFSLSKDLSVGLIDWDSFKRALVETESGVVWEKNPKIYHYDSDLKIALNSNMLEVLFEKYLPNTVQYKRLVEEYHRLEKVKLPKVDYGKLMKVGDYGTRASQLKEFLIKTGDMPPQDASYVEFPTYDEKLADALKKFQKRHYLKETGELDRVTVLYTRKSVSDKRDLIRLNIERHKLFSRIYDSEFIVINIPEFSLKYYKNGSLVDDIFVVVGREDRPTPIFSDYLEYMVLNPSWVVPQGLMRKDYIPLLVDNPDAMVEQHIHIHKKPSRFSPEVDPTTVNWSQYLEEGKHIPYYFMQYPGVDNVLGQMKFIFPNKYNVYLHDTNSKSLTTLKYRLYSSGCIRLSKPFELLSILSAHTNYSEEQLFDMIESGKTKNVSFKTRIPIYIRYFTTFVNADGLNFRRDFYGIDALQLNYLRY